MPKFLITTTLIILTSWSTIVYLILKVPPDKPIVVISFLICLFTAISFTSTTIMFLLARKERRFARDVREVFRRKLGKGFAIAAFITFAIAIKIILTKLR